MNEMTRFDDTPNSLSDSSFHASAPTMSSREIAELVDKRHDNVRRTIETLAESGVIEFPQIEEIPTATKPMAVYVFSGEQGKRDSIIVVAQLSPEFTARLVDRWQELERARIAPPADVVREAGRIEVSRESRLTMAQNLRLAKMIGLDGNQAAISANRATVAMTGIDTLGLMGITHMTAPQNEALLTPTDIGKRTGIGSARAVNQLLCVLALQHAHRDTKGHIYYEPTKAGLTAGAVMQDTAKHHDNGTPIRQLKWASSICRYLQDHREPLAA